MDWLTQYQLDALVILGSLAFIGFICYLDHYIDKRNKR